MECGALGCKPGLIALAFRISNIPSKFTILYGRKITLPSKFTTLVCPRRSRAARAGSHQGLSGLHRRRPALFVPRRLDDHLFGLLLAQELVGARSVVFDFTHTHTHTYTHLVPHPHPYSCTVGAGCGTLRSQPNRIPYGTGPCGQATGSGSSSDLTSEICEPCVCRFKIVPAEPYVTVGYPVSSSDLSRLCLKRARRKTTRPGDQHAPLDAISGARRRCVAYDASCTMGHGSAQSPIASKR